MSTGGRDGELDPGVGLDGALGLRVQLLPDAARRRAVPALEQHVGGEGSQPERRPGDLRRLIEDLRRLVRVVEKEEVVEAEVLAEMPVVRLGRHPSLEQRDPVLRTAGPERRLLREEDGAVPIRDLHPRVERDGDVDEGAEKGIAPARLEGRLAAEVLDGAEPVHVRQEVLQARREPLDLGARPEIQRLVPGAEVPQSGVDLALDQGNERQQQKREEPGQCSSRRRNARSPALRTTPR
jgi:hypothetical protein